MPAQSVLPLPSSELRFFSRGPASDTIKDGARLDCAALVTMKNGSEVPAFKKPIDEKTEAEDRGFDEADYRRRLSDEYKMLQDKMDKIGGFRFTIKGWAVTAVGAVSAAASAVTSTQTAVILTGTLTVMVVFFFLLEIEQVRLSHLFGDRAHTLERIFSSIDRRKSARVLEPVPHTAHEIAKASFKRANGAKHLSTMRRLISKVRETWAFGRYAHRSFYMTLLIITMLPTLRHWPEITRYVETAAMHISQHGGAAVKSILPQPKALGNEKVNRSAPPVKSSGR